MAQRKRKLYRWYFIVAFGLVSAAVVCAEWIQGRDAGVWGTELFLLEDMRIGGNERFSDAEVIDATGLRIGETTMHDVEPETIQSALIGAFSDFESVSIRRDVPAGLLEVDLIERTPVAWVNDDGRVYAFDAQGVLLERPFDADTDSNAAARETLVELVAADLEFDEAGAPVLDDARRLALKIAVLDAAVHQERQAQNNDDGAFVARKIDASDPEKIVVTYTPYMGKQFTAWLSATTYRQGLRRMRVVARHRSDSEQAEASAAVAGAPIGREGTSSLIPKSLVDAMKTSTASETQATSAPFIGRSEAESEPVEERIDARFSRTIYITSVRGGHDG